MSTVPDSEVPNPDTATDLGIAPLRATLDLGETEPEIFDLAFLGRTQDCPWPKAYGGDMVAQAALAAMRSIEPAPAGEAQRELHSMHSYFMRPVDIGAEVRYEVEKLRDGRGFSTRQVRAVQNGKPVYVAMASFQVPEDGPEFAPDVPTEFDVTLDPESLRTSAEAIAPYRVGTEEAGTLTDKAKAYWTGGRSFDQRHVPGPVYCRVEGERQPHQAVWLRAIEPLGVDEASSVTTRQGADLHRAALAYVCDYTIIEPTLRQLGLAWADPGLVTASLDHAMWFHRSAPVDDWLLYVQQSLGAHGGRGLGLGRFFDRQGALIATVCQEALLRHRG